MTKSVLEKIYREHHQKKGRYGYLFCHGERIPYLQEWIGTGKRVLDLGCRDGMLTQGFAQGNQVIGVDIDQQALKLAQSRLGIETLWLDLNQEWPFEAASFDVVVACEVMEHVFFLDSFLSQIRSVLKPGGLFIGSVPNAFRFRNRWKFLWGKEFETDPTHVRMFSWDRLSHLLEAYFLKPKIIPIRGKVLPILPVSSHLPLALTRLFAKDLLWRVQKKVS